MFIISDKGNKIIREWRIEDPVYLGLDITANNVYSFIDGVVLQVCKSDFGVFIDIQFDKDVVIRFSHLSEANVNPGQVVSSDTHIGKANNYVCIEYLSRIKQDITVPVRIGKVTYYKKDPTPLIDGSLILARKGIYNIEVATSNEYAKMNFSKEQDREFSNLRGHTYVEF